VHTAAILYSLLFFFSSVIQMTQWCIICNLGQTWSILCYVFIISELAVCDTGVPLYGLKLLEFFGYSVPFIASQLCSLLGYLYQGQESSM